MRARLVLLSLLWALPLHAQQVARSRTGMVVAVEAQAAQIGRDVLAAGGNAVDAAVAVGFALAVSYPNAGNLGGGGFMLYTPGDGSGPFCLDFREQAPGSASADMYLDAEGEPIPDASLLGPLAAGVPGSVAGMFAAHQRFGALPWAALLAPAIALAENGFALPDDLARRIADHAERFAQFPASAAIFLPKGIPLAAGEILRQPDLARTLRAIAEQGADGFYQGPLAQELAASNRAAGGRISQADLAAYEPSWREPVSFEYRGHRVVSMCPPSSGGLCLAQMLTGLQLLGADSLTVGSTSWVHRWAEVCRRAYADRYHYGDPDFSPLPRTQLLDRDYLRGRLADFDPGRATLSADVQPGFEPHESEETTHYSVVDASGGAVSLTTTLNGNFGSAFVAGSTGVLLNNEMDDFTTAPGRPNLYGLIQGAENQVAPGKRPLSSMSPTLVFGPDGALRWVLGSPGGSTIITTVGQLICRLTAGESLEAALAAPRVHHQWLPDRIDVERGAAEGWKQELERIGHTVRERGNIGSVHAIGRAADGGWIGVADPRTHGIAVGLED